MEIFDLFGKHCQRVNQTVFCFGSCKDYCCLFVSLGKTLADFLLCLSQLRAK